MEDATNFAVGEDVVTGPKFPKAIPGASKIRESVDVAIAGAVATVRKFICAEVVLFRLKSSLNWLNLLRMGKENLTAADHRFPWQSWPMWSSRMPQLA